MRGLHCTLLLLLAGARAQHEMEIPITGREIEQMLVPAQDASTESAQLISLLIWH